MTQLNQSEQFAYWVNLYNAKTVDLVVAHYPVRSIRDIGISGLLATGPWGKKVVRVEGVDLSLDDVEHKILRPLWRDPRIHYAVNCASAGRCPNLARSAYTGASLEAMLKVAARDYVNSPRGASIQNRRDDRPRGSTAGTLTISAAAKRACSRICGAMRRRRLRSS